MTLKLPNRVADCTCPELACPEVLQPKAHACSGVIATCTVEAEAAPTCEVLCDGEIEGASDGAGDLGIAAPELAIDAPA